MEPVPHQVAAAVDFNFLSESDFSYKLKPQADISAQSGLVVEDMTELLLIYMTKKILDPLTHTGTPKTHTAQ